MYYSISDHLTERNTLLQDGQKGSLDSSVKAQSASVTNMLEKLVMEKEVKFVAFTEEVQY